MIHKVHDGYTISAYGSWRPGVYATERAARYAARFSDAQLQAAQDAVAPGVVTHEQLQAIKGAAHE
jgi:hypothetical protein